MVPTSQVRAENDGRIGPVARNFFHTTPVSRGNFQVNFLALKHPISLRASVFFSDLSSGWHSGPKPFGRQRVGICCLALRIMWGNWEGSVFFPWACVSCCWSWVEGWIKSVWTAVQTKCFKWYMISKWFPFISWNTCSTCMIVSLIVNTHRYQSTKERQHDTNIIYDVVIHIIASYSFILAMAENHWLDPKKRTYIHGYCWWKNSCTSWYNPIIWIFNSTLYI